MGIVLFRVDERLIHGQVVVGWGNQLRLRRYVVFDDDVAASDWEQDLYRLALPDGVEADFHPTVAAETILPGLRSEPVRSVVLFRSLRSAAAGSGLAAGDELNLGGLHHKPGATAVRPYLHLGTDDTEFIQELAARGVAVLGRDLPSSSAVTLAELLAHD